MKIMIKHWTNKPFEVEQEFQKVIETDDICSMRGNDDEIKIDVLTGSLHPQKLRITDKQSINDILKHYGKSEE